MKAYIYNPIFQSSKEEYFTDNYNIILKSNFVRLIGD